MAVKIIEALVQWGLASARRSQLIFAIVALSPSVELAMAQQRTDVLAFLRETSALQRASAGRIRTWVGTYSVKDVQQKTKLKGKPTSPYLVQRSGEIHFKADIVGGRLYTHRQPYSPAEYFRGSNRSSLEIKEELIDDRCILTSEHWLSSPRKPLGQLGAQNSIEGLPREGGTLIKRRPAENGRKFGKYGHVINPMLMFSFGFGDMPIWEALETCASDTADLPVDVRADALSPLRVTFDNRYWTFRINYPDSSTSTWTFDDSPTRNCVEYVSLTSEGNPTSKISAEYTSNEGISFPKHCVLVHYDKNGTENFRRTLTLVSTEFNKRLSDHDFDYSTFGLTNGTRLFDYMSRQMTVYRNGKWLSVDDYNIEYRRDLEVTGQRSLWRIAGWYCVVGVLVVGVVYFIRRRMIAV